MVSSRDIDIIWLELNMCCCNADEDDYEDEDYRRKKKRSREDKLDIMDRKLKSIENLIIEDTEKYYDGHDGELNIFNHHPRAKNIV